MTTTNAAGPQTDPVHGGGPTVGDGAGRRPPAGQAEPPPDLSPQAASAVLPLLTPIAFPAVRDRWERLVTVAMIPETQERIWHALTDPAEVGMWLGRSQRRLDELGVDNLLDFEDGEFFLIRTQSARAPDEGSAELRWLWRWLGLGQPAAVTWSLQPSDNGLTSVTATEEAMNPPADWQTWNGGGWPGILEQLASYLRTGTEWRWPWRRMGPYVQVELPASPFEAWDTLLSPSAIKFWLQRMSGEVAPGRSVTLMMGDASGTVQMAVREVVDPGQKPPSFLPSIDFALGRPAWGGDIGGRIWIEPAGWGRSLLQVFHFGWEALPPTPGLLEERRILTTFWAGAARRALLLFTRGAAPGGPHSWA